jgi:hypothetical protein
MGLPIEVSVMRKLPLVTTALTAALAITACSSVPSRNPVSARQAAYDAAAGKPVNSFRFYGSLWSWEPLGNDQLAIYTRPQQAWLLDVPGCINLGYANAIGLTSYLSQVSVGFDKVLTGRLYPPCTITRIRPIDVKQLKAAQARQRTITVTPRAGSDTH